MIDSLKNPKEVKTLDRLYSRNFYSIAIYQPEEVRKQNLANKIARSRHQAVEKEHYDNADNLMALDEKGEEDTGQSVRDTFPKADFFIDASQPIGPQVERFVQLIFGEPFTTPTDDEYLMFIAKATALRSCDLSRQVGAVVASSDREIISIGCNEVPKPQGGFFVEGRDGLRDNRDKVEGHDPNFNEVKRSISEFIDILIEAGYVKGDQGKDHIAEELLHGQYKRLMGDARVRNLIEFGRVVHAEMHALSQAAMLGRTVKGGALYCTVIHATFAPSILLLLGLTKSFILNHILRV
jgi:cytidine deaminase